MGTADDVRPVNTTTSFVDQNQTYTSHPSHQVFLRQYDVVDGKPVATGKLIEGELGVAGGMATWGEVKEQALHARHPAHRPSTSAPCRSSGPMPTATSSRTRPATRRSSPASAPTASRTPRTISSSPAPRQHPSTRRPPLAVRTNSAFLADIAHTAVPLGKVADGDIEIGLGNPGNGSTEYDNELLDGHFIAGDGRVNENIGLTAVHHVFHSEHNRLADQTKAVVLASGDLAFINEWLATDIAALPTTPGASRRPRLGRRARVPGREVHHRDGVPASGVRGVRAQGAAADQPLRRARRLRHHHQPVDHRRVRARGVSLRALDADRVDRPLRPDLQRPPHRPDRGLPQPVRVRRQPRARRRRSRRRHHPRHDAAGGQRDRRVRHRSACATTCSACRSTCRPSTWRAAATPACPR